MSFFNEIISKIDKDIKSDVSTIHQEAKGILSDLEKTVHKELSEIQSHFHAMDKLSGELRGKCNPEFEPRSIAEIFAKEEYFSAIQNLCGSKSAAQATVEAAKYVSQNEIPDCQETVVIVPGNTTTRLGSSLDDVVWIEPEKILKEGERLRLGDGGDPTIGPQGLVDSGIATFALLGFALATVGKRVRFFPYDWRRSVDDTGGLLADELIREKQRCRKLHVIAHSMGGMVSRAGLYSLAERDRSDAVDGIVQLAPANRGFYGMIEGFQAKGAVMSNVSALPPFVLRLIDFLLRPAELDLQALIKTWPGWYQLLPRYDEEQSYLYDAGNWEDPTPDPALLQKAVEVQKKLAFPSSDDAAKWHLLLGQGARTVYVAPHFQSSHTDKGDSQLSLDRGRLDPLEPKIYTGVDHSGLHMEPEVVRHIVSCVSDQESPVC